MKYDTVRFYAACMACYIVGVTTSARVLKFLFQ